MIREFAAFERQLEDVVITPDELVRDGLGAGSRLYALVAGTAIPPATPSISVPIRRG
jgi:hypothetical protein